MNHDTTNTDAAGNAADKTNTAVLQITRQECQHPFCSSLTKMGSNYCTDHAPGRTPPINTFDWDDDILQPKQDPKPSNRDLQRDIDRLEGKLDAILTLLREDDDE